LSSGAGSLELELWSWSSRAGALELELWSWSSGAEALKLKFEVSVKSLFWVPKFWGPKKLGYY